ncbi:high affinity cAMP-specific and IBMX-insensitive 3',5'-cyclic phosphodiesterase 8B-like [Corticium candelabrum]|uniref:high affinity cAMP-specific and IBMX-insensitive 3',5'-cyclic phosphodiesterase 8B-like n=1 Tax=Corticium candelabrum TaxID=121492 RepID=UPI002E25764E|nr:high affinity cAMP-specific and IBMX-insensitive 3',5'-cyclic phosphodiesterase 8B-like [Corticium candelabrum]
MGCGASVHVSESESCLVEQGAHCDETEIASAKGGESASLSGVVGHLEQLEETLKEALKSKRLSMEAETQTQHWRQGAAGKCSKPKREVEFGPMKLTQPVMQILLVFPREDAQSDAFWWAAERGGYSCDVVVGAAPAFECFVQKHHEVVIIDLRNQEALDGFALCKQLRSVRESQYAVILGILPASSSTLEEEFIGDLLSVGFNKRLTENHDVGHCYNELVMLERGEVLLFFKLLSTRALWEAIESCFDGIEITTPDAEYQYVNHAFEQMSGYQQSELLGKFPREVVKSDLNKPEIFKSMNESVTSGRTWHGRTFGARKNGESYPQDVRIIPVFSPSGNIIHHVGIKRDISQQVEAHDSLRQVAKRIAEVQEELQSQSEPSLYPGRNGLGTPKRRMSPAVLPSPSLSRMHRDSLSQEAPITKVMNMLNRAQEQSPNGFYQSLEKVMDLLRSTELYLPWQTGMMIEDDPRTRDFVGGLMGPSVRKLQTASLADLRSQAPGSPKLPKLPELSEASSGIHSALRGCESWEFRILELELVSDHKPLYWLGQRLFSRINLSKILNIPENTLRHWLQLMEGNYHSSNTYHNSTHAADVLHAACYFLEQSNVKEMLDSLDVAAVLVAAVVHDINHPGKTNSFLCSSGDDLAILYNDISVLESHHAAFSFKLTTTTPGCNIFKGLSPDDYRKVRQSVVDMVLATDMTKHFEYLKKFENLMKVNSLVDGEQPQIVVTQDAKIAAKRILIKTADIANPCRPQDMCIEWTKRISEEYFKQTEEEKRQGLPVNLPVFDRTTCNIPKSQLQFIEYFVLDLFSAWDVFADVPEIMSHLQTNYQHWKDEAVAEEERRNVVLNYHSNSVCRPSPDDSARGTASTTSLDEVQSS